MRLLDRMSKTSLGAAVNQLRLGDACVAFADGVLVIEYGGQTHITTEVKAEGTSIVFCRDHVLIDLWERFGSSIQLRATSEELAAAQVYFRAHGFAVYGAPAAKAAQAIGS
ncbi:MAG: hypothetical protein QM740_20175 [Acidovorax sp.]